MKTAATAVNEHCRQAGDFDLCDEATKLLCDGIAELLNRRVAEQQTEIKAFKYF